MFCIFISLFLGTGLRLGFWGCDLGFCLLGWCGAGFVCFRTCELCGLLSKVDCQVLGVLLVFAVLGILAFSD